MYYAGTFLAVSLAIACLVMIVAGNRTTAVYEDIATVLNFTGIAIGSRN